MFYGYSLTGKTWALAYYIVWPGRRGTVYVMAWRAKNGVWYGLVARHDIWYGLAAMAWYMRWPGRHHMVYGMALGCHMVWPGGHRMVYCMAWRGMSW